MPITDKYSLISWFTTLIKLDNTNVINNKLINQLEAKRTKKNMDK
jgi:hypothetical protein